MQEAISARTNLTSKLLTKVALPSFRTQWADWFDSQGIRYTFFSAALAKEKFEKEEEERMLQELKKEMEGERLNKSGQAVHGHEEGDEESGAEEDDQNEDVEGEVVPSFDEEDPSSSLAVDRDSTSTKPIPSRVRIIGADELITLLSKECPSALRNDSQKVTIGFVGYPNVGKSSTLNALAKSHLVTVSSTPGKTKHFQTIHLSDSIILCDCPGLVFPSFATTKAEMVVNGVLPIDQLREFTGPSELVAQRIPKGILEGTYGIKVRTRDADGRHVERVPRGEEVLQAYASEYFLFFSTVFHLVSRVCWSGLLILCSFGCC